MFYLFSVGWYLESVFLQPMAAPNVIAASFVATRPWSDDFSDSYDGDGSDGDFADDDEEGR